MRKRVLIIAVCVVLLATLFTGCGAKEVKATISNDSGWTFNEVYVAPTASDEWGVDQLGGTNILKSGGAHEIMLETVADNGLYDIEAVDDEGTYWTFMRVPLEAGSEVVISYIGIDAIAVSISPKGDETEIVGSLEGTGDDAQYGATEEQTEDQAESFENTGIEFEFYNAVPDSLAQAYFMVTGATEEDMGYNHLESVAPLATDESAIIGTDDYGLFDILIVGEGGDQVFFSEVTLTDALWVSFFGEESAEDGYVVGLYVEYADGSGYEYYGEPLLG